MKQLNQSNHYTHKISSVFNRSCFLCCWAESSIWKLYLLLERVRLESERERDPYSRPNSVRDFLEVSILIMWKSGRAEMRSWWFSCSPALSVHLLIIQPSCMESRVLVWNRSDSRGLTFPHQLPGRSVRWCDDWVSYLSLLSYTKHTFLLSLYLMLLYGIHLLMSSLKSLFSSCLSSIYSCIPHNHSLAYSMQGIKIHCGGEDKRTWPETMTAPFSPHSEKLVVCCKKKEKNNMGAERCEKC